MANGNEAVATRNVELGNASRIADYTKQGRAPTPRNARTQRASEAKRRRAEKHIQARAEFAARHKGAGWVRGHGGYRERLGYMPHQTDSLGRKKAGTQKKSDVASRTAEIRREKAARGEKKKFNL